VEQQDRLASPYHLFASQIDVGVCCAVRQDQVIPAFIDGETWVFRGTFADPEQVPADFNLRAAQASAALTGYHLFVALRS
jgi:hypothetical protein